MRFKVGLRILEFFCLDTDIVVLDESGFNNHICGDFGYGIKGGGNLEMAWDPKSKNHSLLLAISYKYGIISY